MNGQALICSVYALHCAGVDDAIALLVALSVAKSNSGCELCAITTVFGNTTLENVNRNVATLLAHADAVDVPVYHGAARALVVPPPPLEEKFPGYKVRSEEHTSELQSLMRNSYAVF